MKALIGVFLFSFFSSLCHAIPITYVLYGQSEISEFQNSSQSASIPVLRDDGSVYLNGNTLAMGWLTIDEELMTQDESTPGFLTGGVSWSFMTEGIAYGSSYPPGNYWPISEFTSNAYRLLDEAPYPMEPDNFALRLRFAGTAFQSTFLGGDFSFNNIYSGAGTAEGGRLVSLKGRIDGLMPLASVPEPSFIALMGLAFIAAMFANQQRKRSS